MIKMKQITTKDGSVTFHNEKYDDIYHSVSGAIEESQKKFIEPCNIRSGMKILDICFGIGYNSLMAIHKTKELDIIGIEKDENILQKTLEVEVPEKLQKDYEFIKAAVEQGELIINDLRINLIVGDALDIIENLEDNQFDAVFLDPFSPKKNPELWTENFFKQIYRVMKKGAKLATYSCARAVRDNLQKAGFKTQDVPPVGRRAPSTLAIKI